MRFVKYEWSKLWQNVMLKKIIGLLFVLNIVILVYNVTQQEYKQNYLGLKPIMQSLQEEYETLGDKKARQVWQERMEAGEGGKELIAINLLLQQYDYIEKYPSYLDTVQEQAQRMKKFSIFSEEDSFSYRNIQKTGEDFEKIKNRPLEAGIEWGVQEMNSYFVSDLAVLVGVFLLISTLFWQEKEKGLYAMIRSTRNGRGTLIRKKLTVLGITTILLCLFFYIPVACICGALFGFGNMDRAIQSISSFRECVLPITIKQYIILFVIMKTVAMLCFAYCIACACIWFSGIGQVFALIAAMSGVGFLCFRNIPSLSAWNFFKYVNPVAFLDADGILGVYQNISIFAYPVSRIALTVGILAILALTAMAMTIWGFVRKNAVLQAASSSRIMSWIRSWLCYYRTTRLTKQEWIRFLIQKKGILLLVCMGWIAMTSIQQRESLYETKVMNYRVLINEYQEPLTNDLQREIEQRKKQIEEGEETPLNLEGFYLFYDQYKTVLSMQEKSKAIGQMIDQTSWEYLFFSPNRDYQQAAVWSTFLLLIVVQIFGSDYKKNEAGLILATRKGRGCLSRVRIGICLFLAILIGGMMRGVIAWNVIQYHPIGDCTVPAWSIPRFDLLGDMPIWAVLGLGGMLKLLGVTVFILMMAWITMKVKKQTTAIIIGILLFEVPVLMEVGKISILRSFTLAQAFYPYNLLEENPVQFGIYSAILMILAVIFLKKIWKGAALGGKYGAKD